MALTPDAKQEAQPQLFNVEQSYPPCSTCGCKRPHCAHDGCKPSSTRANCNGHWMSCWLNSAGDVDETYQPKHLSDKPDDDDL